ncbi:hypothetical protein D0T25_10535 [Duganella sp. BJB488]|uniref:hypothetical protein n=1 Tax=unclassified Duganella TaxID=2636909 RepID=UPI000E347D0D|nr:MULTISPECIES: hypothetical protein [unclassified Duganella]NVD74508.1 hypothetical protein [Duganella sp. BJB1802]RFP21681.1 hypothetical protein D0T26_10575 [Duganella sp. BJB489]RFP23474.1 hypothetical protein D0T25_10535 [Duganella sp. BJB488]RFP38640.1 hypothetical protein D0T24_03380 [Duganella sp. BJB480]
MNASPAPFSKKPARAARPLPYWLREFALIRLAVVVAAGALAIGVATVFASSWYVHHAEENRLQALQTRDAARQRFAQVETEKREIRAFQPQFALLRSHGLIGEENRLDWVEQIRQIQERRKLPPLSYEIEPQQAVKLDAPLPLGDYALRGSRMNLRMELLHEGDLFNFLEDLRQRGYYAVQQCTLKRVGGPQNVPNAPTIGADCKLNWLTLAPSAALNAAVRKKGS